MSVSHWPELCLANILVQNALLMQIGIALLTSVKLCQFTLAENLVLLIFTVANQCVLQYRQGLFLQWSRSQMGQWFGLGINTWSCKHFNTLCITWCRLLVLLLGSVACIKLSMCLKMFVNLGLSQKGLVFSPIEKTQWWRSRPRFLGQIMLSDLSVCCRFLFKKQTTANKLA